VCGITDVIAELILEVIAGRDHRTAELNGWS
jgi:hypothetical protein